MIKAVILDVDGTLTTQNSWTALTKDLGGSTDEHLQIFEDLLEEKATYEDSKEKLLRVWQATGNTNKKTFREIFERWPLREEAREATDFLKSRNLITCIITGSMDLYAEVIAKKLDIPFYYANTELVWDKEGKLIDYHYYRDQAGKKLEQFQQFCKEQNLRPEECVVVGDDKNDIELFKIAKGIALKSPDSKNIEPIAWKVIDSLSELLKIL